MKKIFLQAAICFNLISGVLASTEVAEQSHGDEQYSVALSHLRDTVKAGPYCIAPITEKGDLRGFACQKFDKDFLQFCERGNFPSKKTYRVLDYACGTGRWAAMAALHGEMNRVSVAYTARDPFIQDDHANYYNQAWSTYVRENRSSYGSLSVGQAWLKDIAAQHSEKFNSILVRDAIHLFSDEQVAELFKLGFRLTEEGGSIILHVEPIFATIFWNPGLQGFMKTQNLQPLNFDDIFFNSDAFKSCLEQFANNLAANGLGPINLMIRKTVCLSAILDAASANGWFLERIKVGDSEETNPEPLTKEQFYAIVFFTIIKLKIEHAKLGQRNTPNNPVFFLQFKKNPMAQPAEAK